jgi:hypothetical protein
VNELTSQFFFSFSKGKVTPNTAGEPYGWEGMLKVSADPEKQVGVGLKLNHGKDVYSDSDVLVKFDLKSKVKDVDLVLSLKSPVLGWDEFTLRDKFTYYFNNIHDTKVCTDDPNNSNKYSKSYSIGCNYCHGCS